MSVKCLWKEKDGSSMISVLVAFIILLTGIAGFAGAVTTANNMVRRAEMLNAATGTVLSENFYPDYIAASSAANSNRVLPVYELKEDGTAGSEAFTVHGRLRERGYTVTINKEKAAEEGTAETETENIMYDMFFYK